MPDGVEGERHERWLLARLAVDGEACRLWARDQGLPVGRRVRLHVLARDVARHGGAFAGLPQRKNTGRLGDLAVDGKGEIILPS